jgi:predicted TIM-barrel fold metal-dependent hydrolase
VIIDFHAHPGFSRDLKGLRREFRPALRAAKHHGVDLICLNSLGDWTDSPTPTWIRRANNAVLSLMSDHPDLVAGFCYINPRHSREALAEITRCIVKGGMVGLKLWTACRANDRRVDPIAERAAELGVPILQHAWYLAGGNPDGHSSPADVAELARRHPDTRIVMAHLSGAGERGLADIAPHENISVDTSGGEPEAGLVELAVNRLGAHRVVLGTDTPIRSYGVTLGKVRDASLTAKEKRLILGANARRLLDRGPAK